MNKYLNIFTTWLPKRLNPLIASRAAFANPTELKKGKKGGGSAVNYAYNIRQKSNSQKAHLFIKLILSFKK